MKKPLLFAMLIATTAANAQMNQSNEPSIGESSTMYVCDVSTPNLEATTGTGITWDYSSIIVNADTRLVDVADASSSPFASSFPNSTKVIQVENTMNTFITSSSSERISQGFTFNEAAIGDAIITYNNDPQIQVTYPFDYGSSVQDSYDGNASYTFNSVPINDVLTGTSNCSIDGSGTLNLPGGLSLPGVIRYKIIDTATTPLPLIGSGKLIRTQYEYYDYSDQNLPIFIHSTISLSSLTGLALANTSIVLSKYTYSDLSALDKMKTFKAYPNPASDKITLTGDFSENAEGIVLDQTGRILKRINVKNGASVDLSELTAGTYMITLIDQETRSTQTIVKK